MNGAGIVRHAGLVLGGLGLLAACGGGGKATGSTADVTPVTPAGFDFGANNALRVTAFGDSITLGVVGDRDDGTLIITSNNYPNNLQLALRALDADFRVINRGVGGDETREGLARLPGVLARDRPGYLLIMEGTNDATLNEDPAVIVANLERMVDLAQENHTIPVLATIPPNFRQSPVPSDVIRRTNPLIRAMAQRRGVALAEIFDGMSDRTLFGSPDIGITDPLHPNEQGYVHMAQIWLEAMRRAIPASASSSAPPTTPSAGTPSGSGSGTTTSVDTPRVRTPSPTRVRR